MRRPETKAQAERRRRKNVSRAQYLRHAKAGVDKLFNNVIQCLKDKQGGQA